MAVNMTLNFCSKPYRRIFIFNSYIFDKEQMYQIFCEITTMADCLIPSQSLFTSFNPTFIRIIYITSFNYIGNDLR